MYAVYEFWNRKINLISRKDFPNLYLHHVLHSLSLVKVCSFSDGLCVLDLGTGGGFPGVPLAIFFPKVRFVLNDSIRKKVVSLQAICDELAVKNTELRCGRAEDMAPHPFDAVVCRAVAPIPRIVNWSRHLLKKNASLGWYLLKGAPSEVETLSTTPHTVWPISKFFSEEYFKTKHIIHLPPKTVYHTK